MAWSTAPLRPAIQLFERVAVSDLAFARSLRWRGRLAERWPGIRATERLRVEGPRADAVLLAGWLRSRLRRDIALDPVRTPVVTGVWVDGDRVDPPREAVPKPGDLLSSELEQLGRDAVYEAAVRAVVSHHG